MALRSLPTQAPYLSWQQADRERLVSLAVLPPGVHRFERFEAMFRLIALAIGGDWANLEQSYDDFAQRTVQAGVSYVEFLLSASAPKKCRSTRPWRSACRHAGA